MTILTAIKNSGLPVAYGTFKNKQSLPFVVYLGNGQAQFMADNKVMFAENAYQVELYFNKKDESVEEALEKALLDGGFLYYKSMDNYISTDEMYVVYYDVFKGAETNV